MKNKFILPLVALLSITLSACGKKGDTGPQGEQGVPGQNGKDGKDGVDGKDGTSVLTGKGTPEATLGNNGDSYIDVDTWNYYVKENGSWVLKGNIKGSDGQNGQNGQDGKDGKDGIDGVDGQKGDDGENGEDGISVTSIVKTSSNENVDTYTITYSDGTTSTFTVTNGVDGAQGIQGVKGDDGHTPVITIGTNGNWFIDGVDSGVKAQGPQGIQGEKGEDGVSITSIVKTSSNENVDTYTITYSNQTTSTFTVTNGVDGAQGIQGVKGDDGHTPEITIGTNGNWFIDGVDSGIKAQGPQGEKGEKGDPGQNGTNGIDGKDGTSMLTGNGEPSTEIGKNGDSYIDVETWNYYVKENDLWVYKGNIKGTNAVEYVPAIFNNYDGSLIYTNYYVKGSNIVYEGPTPTRDGYIQDEIRYGYVFTGWDLPLENIQAPTIFTAQYELKNLTEEFNINNGITPVISQDGKTITYGLYPQTVVDDENLIEELDFLTTPESNGWYLYQDRYYAKLTAHPYAYGYKTFDNGTEIINGKTYWFKCEPIKWNVLSNNEGEYLLLSSVVLDEAHTTVENNKYNASEIRNWLVNSFYNVVFGLGDSYIQTTTIDNSLATTGDTENRYTCDPTEDRIFLLSYQDYTNSDDYGFDSNESRLCRATDWARARTLMTNADTQNASYWTRTPTDSDLTYWLKTVTYTGAITTNNNMGHEKGVRPAITLKIS